MVTQSRTVSANNVQFAAVGYGISNQIIFIYYDLGKYINVVKFRF